ncbi:MAG: hypothetical protein HKN85_01125 [Gammaproteobacteria bacterium]|nr:hypothetical protein [Gammaproteobacteria bacterium]
MIESSDTYASANPGLPQSTPVDSFSTVSFLLLLVTLAWLPIVKAGMMPGALSILSIFMAAVLVFAAFSSSESRNGQPWLIVWSVFSLCVLMHIFVIPKMFGMQRFFVNQELGQLGDVGNTASSSLPTLKVWIFFTIMWVTAWRVSFLTEFQISWLLKVVFLVSLFQGVFGLSHLFSDGVSVLGLWDKQYYLDDATGTFVNRNHFAGMLAICWPIVLSGLLASRPLLFRKQAAAVRYGIATLYSLIVFLALVTSHSRMGIAAACFGFLVWSVLYVRSRRYEQSGDNRWIPWAIGLFSILFALWFGVQDIVSRFTELENGNSRIWVWTAIFDLPSLAWIVGIGPGLFEDVFHLVQPSHQSVRFIYAHNDYLEFALEFGLLQLIVLALVFSFWIRRSFPAGNLTLRAGAIGSLAAVALHSIVDFNLQIPASAIFFWVAVGLLMNPNLVAQNDRQPPRSTHRKVKRKKQSRSARWTKQQWISFFRSDG